MDLESMKVEIGQCDVSKLETDEDIDREADRLLPDFLERLGNALGERHLNKTAASLNLKPSPADRAAFIRQAGDNFRRNLGEADKGKIKEYVAGKIREMRDATPRQ